MQITEKQINLIKRRLNNKKDLKEVESLYIEAQEEGLEVTEEQAQKGFNWLMNLYKSPTGKIRKNNPYGYREMEALNAGLKGFTFDGHYNAGNAFIDWYTPIYTYIGKNGSTFQYYVAQGKINIIG